MSGRAVTVQLEWIEIHRLLNVRPARLEFNRSYNILLGPPATGKSLLLDVIAAASTGLFSTLRQAGAFDLAFGGLVAGIPVEGHIQASVTPAGVAPGWRWELNVGAGGFAGRHVHRDGRTLTDGTGSPVPDNFFDGVGWQLLKAGPGSAQHLVQPQARFDESLDHFNRMFAEGVPGQVGLEWRTLSLPRVVGVWLTPDMVLALPPNGPGAVDICFDARHLPAFARKATRLFGAQRGRLTLRLAHYTPEHRRYRGMTLTFRQEDMEWDVARLSYGQKRMLAFLHYAACADVVVADDLLNGMPHQWLDPCLDEVGGRQAFLTTRNPLLLDAFELSSSEDFQRTFISCTAAGAELAWENLRWEAAAKVHARYSVGVRLVSEVLRQQGLW